MAQKVDQARSTSHQPTEHVADQAVDALLCARDHGSADEQRRAERNLIIKYLPVATAAARRYRRRGIDNDDLEQVARLGLVKSVRAWQPDKGALLSYVMPTVHGELKRLFRDSGTTIRIPRSLYECQPKVADAERRLRQQLFREPTITEVATLSGVSEERVREIRGAAGARRPLSTDDGGDWMSELTSDAAEREMKMAAVRAMLRPALEALSARERRILALRFVWGQSQQQIATALGVSQMHISRLLAASLRKVRDGIQPPAPKPMGAAAA